MPYISSLGSDLKLYWRSITTYSLMVLLDVCWSLMNALSRKTSEMIWSFKDVLVFFFWCRRRSVLCLLLFWACAVIYSMCFIWIHGSIVTALQKLMAVNEMTQYGSDCGLIESKRMQILISNIVYVQILTYVPVNLLSWAEQWSGLSYRSYHVAGSFMSLSTLIKHTFVHSLRLYEV